MQAEREVRHDVYVYLKAHKFLVALKKYSGKLTRQEMHTLRGQAISGDVDGAFKGLDRILGRKE